jgi:phosphonate degradation associated HDIG domain protein
MTTSPQNQVLEILRASAGSDYIGEPVSQLEHALQAAHFARKAGAGDAAVLAALLHDVGHLCAPAEAPRMEGLGVQRHEHIGAELLRQLGFSNEVQELVRGHVEAKRYLVWKNSRYYERLSEASKGTLRLQGGPMTEREALAFEKDPLFKTKLAVREWDERAKIEGLEVPGLAAYEDLIRSQMTAGCRDRAIGAADLGAND